MNAVPMMVCCSRYIQADNACEQLSIQLKQEKVSKVYLLCARHALQTILPKVTKNLSDNCIKYECSVFTGYSCLSNAQHHSEILLKSNCDFIVGIGGGKCMDTTKLVSKIANTPMGMIPSQLATCASCAAVGVQYDNSGRYIGAFFPNEPPRFVLADLSVFAEAPIRYIAAGIIDSMAKYPEMLFSQRLAEDCFEVDDAALQSAYEMSRRTWSILLLNGRQAYADNRENKITSTLSAVAHTNLVITAVISGLARGCKQLAIAHAFYNLTTKMFPEQWRTYLHGEIVSVGLGAQIYMNDMPNNEIQQLKSLANDLGVPTSLRQIGIEPYGQILDEICSSISNGFPDFSDGHKRKLRQGLETIAV